MSSFIGILELRLGQNPALETGVEILRIHQIHLPAATKLLQFVFDLLQLDKAGPRFRVVLHQKVDIAAPGRVSAVKPNEPSAKTEHRASPLLPTARRLLSAACRLLHTA